VACGRVGRAPASARTLHVPQDETGAWAEFETCAALERVYSSETLVTALETVGDIRFPVSSSTKPDLMVRMLEILDVKGGHRVLDGTVTEAGDTPLWSDVEWAYAQWTAAGRPRRGTGWVSRSVLTERTSSGWTTRTTATTGCFQPPTNRPELQR
jgi:hypothetical protein